ncbi:MAG: hypothetical protein M1490_02910 [Candidatus Bathyarchaeota archaeon]|nr:hypothetical protein [Candidatus Bathyarchaeota archaeon]
MKKITHPVDKERSFSIELKTKQYLKNVTLNTSPSQNVLIEGTIGELKSAQFVEDVILEVVGSAGVLRVNVGRDEIAEVKKQ